jgi:hypothetical protein
MHGLIVSQLREYIVATYGRDTCTHTGGTRCLTSGRLLR